MVDDLSQQPADTSLSDPQPIPDPIVQSVPENQTLPEQPIITVSETPTVEIPQPTIPQPITETPSESSPVENPQIPQTPQSSQPPEAVSPEPPPVVPIPQLRLPFNGNFPLTFGFGNQPEKEEIKKKFLEWEIIGHHGLDFGLPVGTEVIAVDSGKVIQAGENGDFGISVILEDHWGQSLYAHLQETKVILDQQVNAGDVLGLSGQSGAADDPHLHFAIKPNNSDPNNGYLGFIDPMPYLPPISPDLPNPPDVSSSVPESPQIPQNPQVSQNPEPVISQPVIPVAEEIPVEINLEPPPPVQTVENPTSPNQSQTSPPSQEPIVIKEIDPNEVERLSKEKLMTELELRRQKANQVRTEKKNENLSQIEKLISQKGKVSNDDVCDALHVASRTAAYYLQELLNQGKIKVLGKGPATVYS